MPGPNARRLAALGLAALVASLVGGSSAPRPPARAPLPSTVPDTLAVPNAAFAYDACRRDPAAVPPAVGPDGRPANYLHTCGDRLYDARGREVRITGVNWFGLETDTFAPHGLWSRNWRSILDQIADLGYNAVRLPFSNELLGPGAAPKGINYDRNPDLVGLSGLALLDRILGGARERGLRVVLDRHRPTSAGQSQLWYTEEVPEERWIADWRTLAERYRGDDTIIGVDLHNEPQGAATWGSGDLSTDWRLAAERAGNAVLAADPYLLIFVEGVARQGGDWYWWGGNLIGADAAPVRLDIPGRLVYSPHDYGPGVFWQGWFSDPDFPRNLPRIWDRHWGSLASRRAAPVVLGEFGGRSVGGDAEGQWQRALVAYLSSGGIGFFVWSLNPNSADTGGLLGGDWVTVVADRYELYKTSLAPPIASWDGAPTRDDAATPPRLRALYRAADAAERTTAISFGLRVQNDGRRPVELERLEIRYWLRASERRGSELRGEVDWAAVGAAHVAAALVPVSADGVDGYLRLTFDQLAGEVPGYATSGDIVVRLHRADWSELVQTNDYSFDPASTDFREAPRIGIYLDGTLVWGREP